MIKQLKGFEDYQITDEGIIMPPTIEWLYNLPCIGYITNVNTGQSYRLRDLVFMSFNGDIPSGYCVTNVNGKEYDCRLENLRLVPKQSGSIYDRFFPLIFRD